MNEDLDKISAKGGKVFTFIKDKKRSARSHLEKNGFLIQDAKL